MELLWTPEAIQDRDAIYDYIEANNPTAALALDELLSEKALRLAEYPNLGRLGRVTDTRELVAHQNYVIVYDVVGEQVRVLRILHAARLWPPSGIA
ncbi:type II toxin-antitoxin system RelE/ParE family toxin [Alkalimonas sp. MEB108]|uniref:Type II toxin-antitoxin system RelE/ParE family toxin n=1 Tax=Alkalimonas cellulosilytica TaxID=3058395 RepID=A0ABU7J4V6_9GAMM|nr:type II toxin-antitoxin system RelE/ParE family toxin [Alkalimonas sp. MEB108]MEE2001529.1 type II toxin-antitoxin system RelE/ParE family toxin [Alkalimonas sp. MEB108]